MITRGDRNIEMTLIKCRDITRDSSSNTIMAIKIIYTGIPMLNINLDTNRNISGGPLDIE